ncbi:unnamed protein product [Amoebophrya sp. A120]|nr:unnamed protein product [Amoebophrya sp. A120]|eukprot:GSA120T00020794001.1
MFSQQAALHSLFVGQPLLVPCSATKAATASALRVETSFAAEESLPAVRIEQRVAGTTSAHHTRYEPKQDPYFTSFLASADDKPTADPPATGTGPTAAGKVVSAAAATGKTAATARQPFCNVTSGSLKWGSDTANANFICCNNHDGAENAGYFDHALPGREKLFEEMKHATPEKPVLFYDAADTGTPVFRFPAKNLTVDAEGTTTHDGTTAEVEQDAAEEETSTAASNAAAAPRSFEEWKEESSQHGWPSFRAGEVITENITELPASNYHHEVLSKAGTHFYLQSAGVAFYKLLCCNQLLRHLARPQHITVD